jgi:hypothetical protein
MHAVIQWCYRTTDHTAFTTFLKWQGSSLCPACHFNLQWNYRQHAPNIHRSLCLCHACDNADLGIASSACMWAVNIYIIVYRLKETIFCEKVMGLTQLGAGSKVRSKNGNPW